MRSGWLLGGVTMLCALTLALPSPAGAAPVLVLGEDGEITRRHDPGVASRSGATFPRVRSRPVLASTSARRRTVRRELRRMYDAAAIDATEYAARRDAFKSAVAFSKRLPAGRRRVEMQGVIRLMKGIAANGMLTVTRLEPLWLTLQRNREWWGRGALLASGQRVSFSGSELIWQYVPGQGLAIHPLANFGKLNGLWREKISDDRLEVLLDELLAIPAQRGAGIAWEYYFTYAGGRPPWVSGMAQGTALQSLARAGIRLQRKDEVMAVAREGLPLFEEAAPTGVRVEADGGAHYLLYSFNPRLRVLNGFIQALVGVNDFAAYANDDRARAIFAAGEASARVDVPRYDTGAWSLYARGSSTSESSLSYHDLVTGFLKNLCRQTLEPVYCETRERFAAYLREPPALAVLTERLRAGQPNKLRFTLSKISRVRVSLTRGDRVALDRSFVVGRGERTITVTPPRSTRLYGVRIDATDLAGNPSRVEDVVEVLPPRKRRRRG